MIFYKLHNPIKNYDWGTKDFITDLLGLEKSEKPQAELWMGAHPQASSQIIQDEKRIDLFQAIQKEPHKFLGKIIAEKYANLPFLFKILSAAKPLSIQAHPDKKQAEIGFQKENAANIPLSAFERNYKDDNHKPELICALTDFDALCGFRSIKEITKNLSSFKTVDQIINEFLDKPDIITFRVFFQKLMDLSEERKKKLIRSVLEKTKQSNELSAVISYWINELQHHYPDDIGVLAPLIINIIHLRKNEALYLSAGILHSYLKGTGVEIMANSDNVLRGGLTHKHIDLPELMKTLVWENSQIKIIQPEKNGSEMIYHTPAEEFELSSLELQGEKMIQDADQPEIYLCLKNDMLINKTFRIKKGESFFVPAEEKKYLFTGKAKLFRAKVPTR